jgi:hypothetical protein
MASPIGDNIDLLSTTTPLTSGSTWTSPAVVLGVYNSLVVMVKTDVDSTLYIDHSGDNGINWDATDVHTIVDTITKRVVITTQQKTIRLRLTNGASNQTYLRLFTYGVVTNNSSLVSLVNSIDVSNLLSGLSGNQTQVTQFTPLLNYNFQQVASSIVTCNSRNLKTGYSDIWTYSPDVTPQCGYGSTAKQYEYLFLRGSNAVSEANISGRGFLPHAGATYISRFVSSFSISDSTNSRMTVGVTKDVGSTPLTIGQTQWWGGFGWISDSAVKTNDNFSIVYGQSLYVERTAWALDKADGNSTLPEMDFTDADKFNMFQVEFTLGGNIRFSIMNPSTDKFVPVHEIRNLNSTSFQVGTRSLFFGMHTKMGAVSTGTDEIRCNCFSLSTDLPLKPSLSLKQNIGFDVAVGGATINPIILHQDSSVSNQAQFSTICLESVSISTSGLAPVTVKFMLDADESGGSWVSDTVLPMRYNTTATVTPSTKIIHQFELSNEDSVHKEFDALNTFLFGSRKVGIQVSSKSTSDIRICLGLSQA